MSDFPWTWTRGRKPSGREGQRCRPVPRGDARYRRSPAGMVHVEFSDGQRFIVDRQGLDRGGRG